MKFISHRGNLFGKDASNENNPEYILRAIEKGFDCEIDIWYIEKKFFLGHDKPQYQIPIDFLNINKDYLWIHCKNIQAILELQRSPLHFFWHEEDTITLTSNRIIWAFPGKQPIENSIAVMPEIFDEKNLENCFGICSDYIQNYRQQYGNI